MKILAIESSCDETSAAIVERTNTIKVASNTTATSLQIHGTTGGIIPENAAREQVKWIIPVISESLEKAQISLKEIDAIAVTYGPGLIGSLLVGVETAKTLSFSLSKPIIPVNHLLAHIYANFIDNAINSIEFPFIGLIVSGGHTDLLYFKSHQEHIWLGGTRDDAAGEALDKIGRLIGIPYPAGAEIEKRAQTISNPSIRFTSPLLSSDDFDFSFSGLKTEVGRYVSSLKTEKIDENIVNQICHGVQESIIKVLVRKMLKACEKFGTSTLLIGGGVSANQTLKNALKTEGEKQIDNFKIYSPRPIYCTDNAAMIGSYALMCGQMKDWKEVSANPELYFDEPTFSS